MVLEFVCFLCFRRYGLRFHLNLVPFASPNCNGYAIMHPSASIYIVLIDPVSISTLQLVCKMNYSRLSCPLKDREENTVQENLEKLENNGFPF